MDRCECLPGQSLKPASKTLTEAERKVFVVMHLLWITTEGAQLHYLQLYFVSKVTMTTMIKVLYLGQSFIVTVGCLDQLKMPLNSCLIQSQYNSADFLLG